MTAFKDTFKNLSEDDRRWLVEHRIVDEGDLIEAIDKLSNIFSDLSCGIVTSFLPVIEAFDKFLKDVPAHVSGNRIDNMVKDESS